MAYFTMYELANICAMFERHAKYCLFLIYHVLLPDNFNIES